MHRRFKKLDPRWQEFAASLRKGQLYVKMPIAKALVLLLVWSIVSVRVHERVSTECTILGRLFKLIKDEAEGSQTYGISSVFYMISVEECEEDIEALQVFADKDQTGVFKLFKEVLEKGLQSDPGVDWVERIGGPPAHPFEALQTEPNPTGAEFPSLADFGDEPIV